MKHQLEFICGLLTCFACTNPVFAQDSIQFVNPAEHGLVRLQIWPASVRGPTADFAMQPGETHSLPLESRGKFNIRAMHWTPDENTCSRWLVSNLDLHAIADRSVLSIKLFATREAAWQRVGAQWQEIPISPNDTTCVWEFTSAPTEATQQAFQSTIMNMPAGCPISDRISNFPTQ